MSQYRRSRATGASFFFTVNTLQRRPWLTRDEVRPVLRAAIERARTKMPFQIDAWVLLPDHLHCIWTLPDGDAAFRKRWGLIKAYVSRVCGPFLSEQNARSASRVARRETDLWQRRFWEHQIRDDSDFARHVDYIHLNPVKHGYVERVGDWPHSTFHRYAFRGIYPANWTGGAVSGEGKPSLSGL